MKNIKGYITAATLLAAITFGSTFAHAGIIVAGRDGSAAMQSSGDPCSDSSTDLGGIIVAGITAAAEYASGGIIVAGATQETCGIIVAG